MKSPGSKVGKRVLIVEDESSIAFNIECALQREGFETSSCSTCHQALELLGVGSFDLLILDVGLPDGNGFDLCRDLRRTSSLPIIILTARSDEVDKVVGLELGADDYVTKPFSPRELAARVKTILRRVHAAAKDAQEPALFSFGPFQADDGRFSISYFQVQLSLSRMEFRILRTLLGRPGWVFTREKLMELVWDAPDSSMDRTVDAHIKTLRAKLRAVAPGVDPIVTHRGIGYSLLENF